MHAQVIKPKSVVVWVVKQTIEGWRYLLIRRRCEPFVGNWQMVSGGIDEGEQAWQAALREMYEETGLKPERFYSADFVVIYYDQRCDRVILTPAFVAFVTDGQDVKLSPTEHDMYQWLSCQDALPFIDFQQQRQALAHIQEHYVLGKPNELLRIQF